MAFKKNIFDENNGAAFNCGPTVTYNGHMRKEKDWGCASHFHECAELLFCIDGCGSVLVEDQEYEMREGDIAIFNPFVSNATRHHNGEDFEFFFLGITDFSYPPFPLNTLMPDNTPVFSSGPYKKQLQFYFQELMRETANPEVLYMPAVSALANVIAIQVLRIWQFNSQMEKNKSDARSYSHFIKEYIDKNYHQAINLDTLSEASFISKSYISHQFKKDMGMSPIDYLIKKRIEIACYLLVNTHYPVAEVAKQIGYDNPLYFSALFKKNTGMSPTEYRKTYKQDRGAGIPKVIRKTEE